MHTVHGVWDEMIKNGDKLNDLQIATCDITSTPFINKSSWLYDDMIDSQKYLSPVGWKIQAYDLWNHTHREMSEINA